VIEADLIGRKAKVRAVDNRIAQDAPAPQPLKPGTRLLPRFCELLCDPTLYHYVGRRCRFETKANLNKLVADEGCD